MSQYPYTPRAKPPPERYFWKPLGNPSDSASLTPRAIVSRTPRSQQEHHHLQRTTDQRTPALPQSTRNSEKAAFFPQSDSPLQSLPKFDVTKCSIKKNGVVKGFAANTHSGLVRNYNEDRVSIILTIAKPANRSAETWPKCSFFGLYDGHGGSGCADFLRDTLHQIVIRDASFPSNPRESLYRGILTAENTFLGRTRGVYSGPQDRSGSCACVALVVGETCYVANVGDSRAVLSGENGSKVYPLSLDHKPNSDIERRRIAEAGGSVYQTNIGKGEDAILGPVRVLPGRLSVSRTIGDAEAKIPALGGNQKVIIPTPDIKVFRIQPDHDFIVMCSDGVFDRLSNKEVIQVAWSAINSSPRNATVHQVCTRAVEAVMSTAMQRRSLDNVTVTLVALPGLKKRVREGNEFRLRMSEL